MIAAYLRVSTLEQAADGRSSLDEQERRVRGCAMMRGATDVQLYADPGVSGSIALGKRPAGMRMLFELKRGDLIVASKLDRLFRSASDALATVEELQRNGIGVILADIGTEPVTENGTSKLFFSMLAAFAEFERGRILERTNDGRRNKRARNGHIGGEPEFGHDVSGSGRDAMLIPNEREMQVVSVVSELRPHCTLRAICSELENRGLRNRTGTKWHPQQISRIISKLPQAAE